MVDSILAAFQMSINAETLLIVFIGAFYGTIIGALPGLGTVVALTMCLPFTLHMENVPTTHEARPPVTEATVTHPRACPACPRLAIG